MKMVKEEWVYTVAVIGFCLGLVFGVSITSSKPTNPYDLPPGVDGPAECDGRFGGC